MAREGVYLFRAAGDDGGDYEVPESRREEFLRKAGAAGLAVEEVHRMHLPGSDGVYDVPESRMGEFREKTGGAAEEIPRDMTDREWMAWQQTLSTRTFAEQAAYSSAEELESLRLQHIGRGEIGGMWQDEDEEAEKEAEKRKAERGEARREGWKLGNNALTRFGDALGEAGETAVDLAERHIDSLPTAAGRAAQQALGAVMQGAGGAASLAGRGLSAVGAGFRRAGDELNQWTIAGANILSGRTRRQGRAREAVDSILPERAEIRRLVALDAEGRLDDAGRAKIRSLAEAMRERVSGLTEVRRANLVRALREEASADAFMKKWTDDLRHYSDELDDAKYGAGVQQFGGAVANSVEMYVSWALGGKLVKGAGAALGWAGGRTGLTAAAKTASAAVAKSASGRAAAAVTSKAAAASPTWLRKGAVGLAHIARKAAGGEFRSTLLMSVPEYASAYAEAIEEGAGDKRAAAAGWGAFLVAACTEHIPLDAMKAGRSFGRALLSSLVNEGLQEYAQEVMGNAVKLALYKRLSTAIGPDGEKMALSWAALGEYGDALFENAAEAGVQGGLAGMLMGGAHHVAAVARDHAGYRAMRRAADATEKLLSTKAETPEGQVLRALVASARARNPDFIPDIDPDASDADNLRRLARSLVANRAAAMNDALDRQDGRAAQVKADAEAYASQLVGEHPELAEQAPEATAPESPEGPAPAGPEAAPAAPEDRRVRAEQLQKVVEATRRWMGGEVAATTPAEAPDWVKDAIAKGYARETDRGVFDPPTGRIWLNADAAVVGTAPHEAVWHGTIAWAKRNDPALYNAMLDIARNAPDYIKDEVRANYGADIEKDPDLFLDEVGALFLERSQGGRLAEWLDGHPETRRWWEKVIDLFKRIFAKGSGMEQAGRTFDPEALKGKTGMDLMEALVTQFTGGKVERSKSRRVEQSGGPAASQPIGPSVNPSDNPTTRQPDNPVAPAREPGEFGDGDEGLPGYDALNDELKKSNLSDEEKAARREEYLRKSPRAVQLLHRRWVKELAEIEEDLALNLSPEARKALEERRERGRRFLAKWNADGTPRQGPAPEASAPAQESAPALPETPTERAAREVAARRDPARPILSREDAAPAAPDGAVRRSAGVGIDRDGISQGEAVSRLSSLRGGTFTNARTGISARLSSTGAGKLVSNAAVAKSVRNGFTPRQHNAIAARIDELFRDAVLAEDRPDRNGDPNVRSIKRFAAPVTVGGEDAAAWITVKESTQHGHRIYSVEGIQIEALSPTVRRALSDSNSADSASPGAADDSASRRPLAGDNAEGNSPESNPTLPPPAPGVNPPDGAVRRSAPAREEVSRHIDGVLDGTTARAGGGTVDIRGDREAVRADARRIFDAFADERIPLSTGGVLYFAPGPRTVEAYGGDMAKAWAEYAVHLATHDAVDADGKHYRTHSSANLEAVLPRIREVVAENKAQRSGDRVLLYKQTVDAPSRNASRFLKVVAEIEADGNLRADLKYVTGLVGKGRVPGRLATLGDALSERPVEGGATASESNATLPPPAPGVNPPDSGLRRSVGGRRGAAAQGVAPARTTRHGLWSGATGEAVNPNLVQDIERVANLDGSAGKVLPRGAILVFGRATGALRVAGIPDGNVITEADIVRKMAGKHGLSKEDIAALPAAWARPVAVLRDGGKFLVLTDRLGPTKDGGMRPVMVTLRPSGLDGGRHNYLATAFAREAANENKYIELMRRPGAILYLDKSKASAIPLQEETMSQFKPLADGSQAPGPESIPAETAATLPPPAPAVNPPDSGVRRSAGAPAQRYYDVPFQTSLKAVVAPGSTVRENVFVRDTPQVFRDIGMEALPIMASPRHLRLNYHDKASFTRDFGAMRQGEHAHGLGSAMLYLPKALEHPLAIVANMTPNATPGSVVALTDLTVQGRRVVVPVLIETQVQAGGNAVDAHLVLTVYDSSDWIAKFVNPAVAAERAKGVGVFFLDEKRTGHINALSGLVKGVAASGVLHRIDDPGSPVKGFQKRQTDTVQFRRWFGRSKVVDSNGEPLVCAHRTGADFEAFDMGLSQDREGREAGLGWGAGKIYLVASEHENFMAFREGQKVLRLFARAENPIDGDEYDRRLAEKTARTPGADPDAEGYDMAARDRCIAELDAEIRAEGHDAIWNRTTGELAVFDPSQVKSADENIGTFDRGDNRLRFSRGPSPAGRSAAARAVREAFPEATWRALPKSSPRAWAYDPDGKTVRVKDPADPAAALRAAGAHADLQHLGDASGLMLYEADAMEAAGRADNAAVVRRAEAEFRALGADYAGPKASKLAARRAGFAEAFARAIEDPAALRRDAPAAARYLDACLAEAPAALGRKLSRVREAQTRAALATPENAIKLFMEEPDSGASGAGMGEMAARATSKARDFADGAQERFFDEWHGIIRAFREAGVDEAALPPSLDPWRVAGLLRRDAPGRAWQMVSGEGVRDIWGLRKTAGSLSDVLRRVRKEGKVDDFCEYAVARVAKMRNARGTPSGLTDAECDAAIARLDSPLMRRTLDEFTKWNHAVMHLMVDCGAWTEEEYRRVVEANPVYAPFHRRLPGDAGKEGGAMRGVPVRKFTGSNWEIYDIIDSACLNGERIVKYAIAHHIRQTFAKCLDYLRAQSEAARAESQRTGEKPGPDALRPLAKYLEEVEAPVKPVEVSTAEAVAGLRKAAADAGADVDAALDSIAEALAAKDGSFSVFRRGDAPAGVERVVVDGKERYFRFGDSMARLVRAMNGVNGVGDSWLLKILHAPAAALRSNATSRNLLFALFTNSVKDAATIAVTSEYLPPVFGFAQLDGLWHAGRRLIGLSDASRDFFATGLQMAGEEFQDQEGARDAGDVARGLRSAWRNAGAWRRARLVAGQVEKFSTGFVGRLASLIESNPRVAEYCAARKYWKAQGMGDVDAHVQAGCAARLSTVDFTRSGSEMHTLNAITAFINAHVQGFDSNLRAMGLKAALPSQRYRKASTRAARYLWRGIASAGSLGLAAYLWCLAAGRDKDRRKLTDRDKWTSIPLPIGRDQFLRLPLGETGGITFAGLPVALAEYSRLMAEGDEEGARREMRGFLEAATDLDLSGDKLPRLQEDAMARFVLGLLPNLVAPMVHVAFNTQWNGQPIVPARLDRLPTEMKYDETTWKIFREIGPAIGMAPMKMQYAFNQYTASLAEVYGGATGRDAEGDDLRGLFLIGRRFTAPGRTRAYGDWRERMANVGAAVERCREAAAEGYEPPYQVTLEDVGRLALDRREEGAVRELRRRRNAALKDPSLTKSGQRAASAAIDRELTAKLEQLEAKTEAECREAGLVRCAELVLAKTEKKKGDREAALRVLRESGATYDEIGLAWSRAKGRGPRDMRFRNGKLTPFGEQLDRLWRLSGAGWREMD